MLQHLDLAGNELGPCLRGVKGRVFGGLAHLDLSRNRLRKIDDAALGAFPALECLVASNNALSCPPRHLRLLLLRVLRLNDNCLVEIFPRNDATWLPSLEELHVASNRLESCRISLEAAPNLKRLDLSHNDVRGGADAGLLATALATCPKLKDLALRGNPIIEDISSLSDPFFEAIARAAATTWGLGLDVARALAVASKALPKLERLDSDAVDPALRDQLRYAALFHERGTKKTATTSKEAWTSSSSSAPRLAALSRLFPRTCSDCGLRLALPATLLGVVRDGGESPPLSCPKCQSVFALPPWPLSFQEHPDDEETAAAASTALLEERFQIGAAVCAARTAQRLLRQRNYGENGLRDWTSLEVVVAPGLLRHFGVERRRVVAKVLADLGAPTWLLRRDAKSGDDETAAVAVQRRYRGRRDRLLRGPLSADWRAAVERRRLQEGRVRFAAVRLQGIFRSVHLRHRVRRALAAAKYVDYELEQIISRPPIDVARFDRPDNQHDDDDDDDYGATFWARKRPEEDTTDAEEDTPETSSASSRPPRILPAIFSPLPTNDSRAPSATSARTDDSFRLPALRRGPTKNTAARPPPGPQPASQNLRDRAARGRRRKPRPAWAPGQQAHHRDDD